MYVVCQLNVNIAVVMIVVECLYLLFPAVSSAVNDVQLTEPNTPGHSSVYEHWCHFLENSKLM